MLHAAFPMNWGIAHAEIVIELSELNHSGVLVQFQPRLPPAAMLVEIQARGELIYYFL